MFTDLALIFDFAPNSYAFLSLIAALVNFSLVILIHLKGVSNETNRWFRLLLAAIILWSSSEFLVRASGNAEASLFWDYTGRPGWIFIPTIFFGFAMSFIGKEVIIRSRRNQFLIFGPALFFLFLSWNTNLILNNNVSETIKTYWGWDVPLGSYFLVFLLWLEAFLLSSVVILSRFYFKLSDEVRKRQVLLIIIAVLIPIIGGTLTDAILPMLGVQVLPLAVLLTSVMSIIITYAILRYSLFALSPTLTAHTIIDTMSESLLIIDQNHNIKQVNKATLDLLGFREDELIGRSIRGILPDIESWDRFLKKVLIPLKKRSFVRGVEVNFRTKGGREIPVSFSAITLLEKGHFLGVVGLARDIRETKKLINRLTAERNKVSVTLGGIVEGIFAVDRQGKIILFNPALEKMLETGSDEVVGRNADEVIFMTDGEQKIGISDLLPKERIYKDKLITKKENIKIIKKDGSSVFVDLTSSTIAEGEEIDLGAIVMVRDVSKEHELEDMKLDFVSMAAHELRTPLTSVRGYLSVLQDELIGKVSKEQFAFLQKAFISSSQLASLVENLLSVSRIERGRMKIEKSPIDWSDLVSEVVGNFMVQARQKGLELGFKKPKEKIPRIFVDRFRMSEVLSNIIGNAINYTDPGGSVEVSSESKENEVITHIKDTGQGIPEEALPRLFTKFFRVSGVLEQGSKGTGLGLYISKAIVEMHDGKIWVKSKLGAGSTFSFSLPVTSEAQNESETQKTASGEAKKEKVGMFEEITPQKRTFVKNGRKLAQPS